MTVRNVTCDILIDGMSWKENVSVSSTTKDKEMYYHFDHTDMYAIVCPEDGFILAPVSKCILKNIRNENEYQKEISEGV